MKNQVSFEDDDPGCLNCCLAVSCVRGEVVCGRADIPARFQFAQMIAQQFPLQRVGMVEVHARSFPWQEMGKIPVVTILRHKGDLLGQKGSGQHRGQGGLARP
ncbi:hypothetical protein JCM14713_20080 [Desulfomicrobium salsuginis]